MTFWRKVKEWIVGILFGALLLGTVGAPSAQLYYAQQNQSLLISKRSLLRDPPLGVDIWKSIYLSNVGSILGITGAGLFWLSTLIAGPDRGGGANRNRRQKICELGLLPLCGTVCIVATVIEILSVRRKRKFLPLFGSKCHGTATWPVYVDGVRSFWNIADLYFASQMGITDASDLLVNGDALPFDWDLGSYHFLLEYRLQIIASTCILFLGLGLLGTVMLDHSDRFHKRTIISKAGYYLCTWLGVICILSVAGPIFCFFEFIEKVAPWTRYRRAYAAKICEMPLSWLRPIFRRASGGFFFASPHDRYTRATSHWRRQKSTPDIEMAVNKVPESTSPSLAICKYDIAVVLSQHMHYPDLVALSQTCRAWHECFFSADEELVKQQARFKRYTCDDDWPFTIRRDCWSCSNQVCNSCWAHKHSIDQDVAPSHQDRCVPYCKSCFRALMRGTIRRNGCRSSKHRHEEIHICRPCQNDKKIPFLWKGSYKWRHEIQKRNMLQEKCGKCAGALEAKGARFWVCKKEGCEHECRSSAHPNWIKLEKADKVEEVVVTSEEIRSDDDDHPPLQGSSATAG